MKRVPFSSYCTSCQPGGQALILFLLVLFTGLAPLSYANTVVKRVSFADRSDGQGIVVRVHTDEPVNAYSEPRVIRGERIEMILFNAELDVSYAYEKPRGPISNFTVEHRNGHLILNFDIDANYNVDAAAYRDGQTSDLLLGLTFAALQQASRRPAPAIEVNGASGWTRPATKEVQASETADHATSQSSTGKPLNFIPSDGKLDPSLLLDTVVIDAGHGGHDSGAVAHGVKEKDVNLNVALLLGHYLETRLGMNVIFTREDDSFVELHERGNIANRAGAKLFISIHSNASAHNKNARGTETYFLGMHRTEDAMEIIERENSVIDLEENQEIYDDFYHNSIVRTMALSANMRLSEKLAMKVEHQFRDRAQRPSRGVKQAGFIVLWAASMPSILVELGYLTNRWEAAYLNSESGQDYLASAIFRAVRDFKVEYERNAKLMASKSE